MDRRAFLGLAAAGVIPTPAAARAQQTGKSHRIGFLSTRSGLSEQDEVFRQGLRELGYVEGRNLIIEYRWAAGKEERIAELAADLVRLKVEIIVAAGGPSIEAAKRATSTIPIVMAAVADPVGLHLVDSIARPGGNVTGLTLMSTELAAKKLQLLREFLPKATRVAILSGGSVSAMSLYLEQMRAAAQQMGIQLFVQEVGEAGQLPAAFAAMQRDRVHALIVRISTLILDQRQRVADLAAQHRLPAMYETRSFVDAGGLVSYGPNVPEMYRRAAFYVDRILRGAKPADLPIEQPTKFELIINLQAAKAIGMTIPQALLVRADQVIQ
jgi:putative tryptophan/tyrosine transport system substrate-binding protein